MTSKHTPGPWLPKGAGVYSTCHTEVINSGRTVPLKIATIKAVEIDRAMADAHLIAAAPDLLEALKVIRRYWADWEPREQVYVDATIAKAEGR